MLEAVELFAGIGGFRLAADARKIRTVWANDIDAKSAAVYRQRFGTSELREGDIRELEHEVPKHNFLTGGFPCQPFSSAGKKQGVRDPRGTLFQSIVNVLHRHLPEFFILENVKRLLSMENGAHFATILSVLAELDYLIEWRLLNAMHFGLAQNRQRIVMVGIRRTRDDRLTSEPRIRLVSKIELGTLRPRQLEQLVDRSSWRPIARHGERFPTWGIAEAGHFFGGTFDSFRDAQEPVFLASVLEPKVSQMFDFTDSTVERVKNSKEVRRFVDGVEILTNQGGGARMGYTVFGINGVAPTLTAATSRHYERYRIGDRYRRLTNVEYARLQGFPDDHCYGTSIYDQYMLFGNAVPPPLAGWAMDRMLAIGIAPTSIPAVQGDLFNRAS